MKVSFGKQFSEATILHRRVLLEGEPSPLVLKKVPNSCRKWQLFWEGELPAKLEGKDIKCDCEQLVLPEDGNFREMKRSVVSWVEQRTDKRRPLYNETRPFWIFLHGGGDTIRYYGKYFYPSADGVLEEVSEA